MSRRAPRTGWERQTDQRLAWLSVAVVLIGLATIVSLVVR